MPLNQCTIWDILLNQDKANKIIMEVSNRILSARQCRQVDSTFLFDVTMHEIVLANK